MPRLSYSETRKITEIVNHFDIASGVIDMIESFGDGRINRTFKIIKKNGTERFKYLLQEVNHSVFADTDGLMRNLTSVTEHIRKSGEIALKYIKCKASTPKGNING